MFDLIEQTKQFIVIHKHPDVSVHKDESESSFLDAIKHELNISDLFLVHRLDKITSGVMLLAKNAKSAKKLGELFASRGVKKTYIALSDKKPKKKQGTIRGDMRRARGGAWELVRSTENPAITRFTSLSLKENLRLFYLYPETGKTHQLRVMMRSIGAPILGDSRYRGSEADRAYLHCLSLEFELDGKHYAFESRPKNGTYFHYFNDMK